MKKSKQTSALVSFGNYLLSDERKKLFASHPEPGSLSLEERLSRFIMQTSKIGKKK